MYILSNLMLSLALTQADPPLESAASEIPKSAPIVVTARKTDETLLDTPLAVAVINGEAMERHALSDIEDIAHIVPGFSVTPAFSTRATGPKIRGISTFSFSDGLESSVATVVDGVALGREAQGYMDLFDVEAVEIVKGPQGTLFGSNASAGLIAVRTREPEFDAVGGHVALRLGSRHEQMVDTVLTGPLSPALAVRLATRWRRHGGHIDSAWPNTGALNDKDAYAVRAKLTARPGSLFEVRAALELAHEDDNCCVPTFRSVGPPSAVIALALNDDVLQLPLVLAEANVEAGPNNRVVPLLPGSIRNRSTSKSVTINAKAILGDATLSWIGGWRDFAHDDNFDADGVSSSNVSNLLGATSTARQLSQELRLRIPLAVQGTLVAGLFAQDQRLENTSLSTAEIALPFPPYFNVSTITDSRVERRQLAAYAEATINLASNTALILGGRLSNDRTSADYRRNVTPVDPVFPFGPIFGGNLEGEHTLRDTALSGRAIVRHYFARTLMGYATWSQGYKAPGVDVALTVDRRAIERPGGLPTLPAERPQLREIGLKSDDGHHSLAIAAFDQDLYDLQTIQTDTTGALTNLSIDRLISRGVEIDTRLRSFPLKGFDVALSLAYLDIRIARFDARPDLERRRFRDNPRWSWAASTQYRTRLSSRYDGFGRIEGRGQSEKYSSTNLDPFSRVPASTTVNVRAGMIDKDRRGELVLAIDNLFDRSDARFIYGSPYRLFDGETSSQFVGAPRRLSMTFLRGF